MKVLSSCFLQHFNLRCQPFHSPTKKQNQISWSGNLEILSLINSWMKGNWSLIIIKVKHYGEMFCPLSCCLFLLVSCVLGPGNVWCMKHVCTHHFIFTPLSNLCAYLLFLSRQPVGCLGQLSICMTHSPNRSSISTTFNNVIVILLCLYHCCDCHVLLDACYISGIRSSRVGHNETPAPRSIQG